MEEGSLVGDARLILWRLEAPSTAAEFDVGGWRPGGMISRVKEESRERQFDFVIFLSVVFCCVLFLVSLLQEQDRLSAQIHISGW